MRTRMGLSGPPPNRRYLHRRESERRALVPGPDRELVDAVGLLTTVAWMLTAVVAATLAGILIGRRSWDDLLGPAFLAAAQWMGVYPLRKRVRRDANRGRRSQPRRFRERLARIDAFLRGARRA